MRALQSASSLRLSLPCPWSHLAADDDEELVDVHRGVDRDLAPKVVVKPGGDCSNLQTLVAACASWHAAPKRCELGWGRGALGCTVHRVGRAQNRCCPPPRRPGSHLFSLIASGALSPSSLVRPWIPMAAGGGRRCCCCRSCGWWRATRLRSRRAFARFVWRERRAPAALGVGSRWLRS